MRWQLVNGYLADDQGRLVEEGQTVEFKESPNTRARQEAIQTCVAFANRDGGRIFFGVADDGLVKGTDMSGKSIENLADEIRDHTYPSILPPVDQIDVNGKKVVAIDVAAYVPPVVGVYLYSDDSISQDKPVDAENVQAFVRVGRTNQKEDFMRLRQQVASDPRLRLQLTVAALYRDNPMSGILRGLVWAEEGSATAHGVTFSVEPLSCQKPTRYDDLPFPSRQTYQGRSMHGSYYYGFTSAVDFELPNLDLSSLPPAITVIVNYRDDQGLTWRVSRRVSLTLPRVEGGSRLEWEDLGEFRRRIVVFPPKVQ